jgi:hypothetical protein
MSPLKKKCDSFASHCTLSRASMTGGLPGGRRACRTARGWKPGARGITIEVPIWGAPNFWILSPMVSNVFYRSGVGIGSNGNICEIYIVKENI